MTNPPKTTALLPVTLNEYQRGFRRGLEIAFMIATQASDQLEEAWDIERSSGAWFAAEAIQKALKNAK